jgi:hypothetical protein
MFFCVFSEKKVEESLHECMVNNLRELAITIQISKERQLIKLYNIAPKLSCYELFRKEVPKIFFSQLVSRKSPKDCALVKKYSL